MTHIAATSLDECSMSQRSGSVLVFLLCFGSIWTMLGALWRIAPMHALCWALLVPSLVGLVVAHVWARRAGHADLDAAMTVGWWGGLWGTMGYDVIRVPFHMLGFNPFPPIRSYGMFLVDASHSTLWSDLVGVLYHFSNGLTFGVMYAVVMRRRHWGWGVLWGLVLESLAAITPFGAIYGLRTNLVVLGIAYFAHVYYGFPLGVAAQDPERLIGWTRLPRVRAATAIGAVATISFLVLIWTPRSPDPEPGTVHLGPVGMVAGWTRVDAGAPVVLVNDDAAPLSWSIGDRNGTLAPGDREAVVFDRAGIRQLVVSDRPWRSVLISVERDGYPAEPGTW